MEDATACGAYREQNLGSDSCDAETLAQSHKSSGRENPGPAIVGHARPGAHVGARQTLSSPRVTTTRRRPSPLSAPIARALYLTRVIDWLYRAAERARSELVAGLASEDTAAMRRRSRTLSAARA